MRKKQDDQNLNRIFFSKCKVADCDFYEGNQNWNYGETPFRQWKRILFSNNFLEILDYQVFDGRIIFNCFSIESSSKEVKVSIAVLTDELKPVVFEKSQCK